jgi:hypothetical protein
MDSFLGVHSVTGMAGTQILNLAVTEEIQDLIFHNTFLNW